MAGLEVWLDLWNEKENSSKYYYKEQEKMNEYICPLCGQTEECSKMSADQNGYVGRECKHYGAKFFLSDEIINLRECDLKEKLLNLVAEHVLHHKAYCIEKRLYWHFFYNPVYDGIKAMGAEYVNLADLLLKYPSDVLDIAKRSLVNLAAQYPNYGDNICLSFMDRRIIFEHNSNNQGSSGVLEILADLGYLKDPNGRHIYNYRERLGKN